MYRLLTRKFCNRGYNFLNNRDDYLKRIFPNVELDIIQKNYFYSFRINPNELQRLQEHYKSNDNIIINKVVIFNKLLRGGIQTDKLSKPLTRKEIMDIIIFNF